MEKGEILREIDVDICVDLTVNIKKLLDCNFDLTLRTNFNLLNRCVD